MGTKRGWQHNTMLDTLFSALEWKRKPILNQSMGNYTPPRSPRPISNRLKSVKLTCRIENGTGLVLISFETEQIQ